MQSYTNSANAHKCNRTQTTNKLPKGAKKTIKVVIGQLQAETFFASRTHERSFNMSKRDKVATRSTTGNCEALRNPTHARRMSRVWCVSAWPTPCAHIPEAVAATNFRRKMEGRNLGTIGTGTQQQGTRVDRKRRRSANGIDYRQRTRQ